MILLTKLKKKTTTAATAGVLLRFLILFILLECDETMGMQSGKIEDSNLKSSSEVCYVKRHFELLHTRVLTYASIFLISS